jgi:hypothetical protein
MIISKMGYYQFRRGLADTIAYLKTLNTEFPDPGHAQKARSMILADTVSRSKMMGENGASLFWVPRQEWPLIGVSDNDPDLIRIEMLLTAHSTWHSPISTSIGVRMISSIGKTMMIATIPIEKLSTCLSRHSKDSTTSIQLRFPIL